MFEKFCPECLEYTHCEPFETKKTYDVKGEKITITAHFLKCLACLEVIPDKAMQDRNFSTVYSEYRKINNLLTPTEIVDVRTKYDLSQRQLAKIIGWSHATLSRYESGALQSKNHNNELVLLREPHNMLKLLEVNSSNLSIIEYERIEQKIMKVIDEEKTLTLRNIILSTLKREGPSILNGYKRFDIDKLIETIKFFAFHDNHLYKVKLMKYLFYADFLNFKRTTVSLNGLKYLNYVMGPVPENYDQLLYFIVEYEDNGLNRDYISFTDGVGELFSTSTPFNENIFTRDELDTLKTVLDFVKPHNSASISKVSHEEDAWKNTADRERISYELADSLSLE